MSVFLWPQTWHIRSEDSFRDKYGIVPCVFVYLTVHNMFERRYSYIWQIMQGIVTLGILQACIGVCSENRSILKRHWNVTPNKPTGWNNPEICANHICKKNNREIKLFETKRFYDLGLLNCLIHIGNLRGCVFLVSANKIHIHFLKFSRDFLSVKFVEFRNMRCNEIRNTHLPIKVLGLPKVCYCLQVPGLCKGITDTALCCSQFNLLPIEVWSGWQSNLMDFCPFQKGGS